MIRRALGKPIARELLPLLPVMAISAIAAALFALQLTEFVVMPDELGYVKQANEMAHGELVLPSDFWFNSWAQLHALLLAPGYRFLSTVQAFDANHVLNALIISTAAIPTYLLTRRVTDSRLVPYLTAAISVAVPWIAMAGTMMTEVLAYPMFTWGVLTMTHAVERPSVRMELLLLGVLALCFFTRTQLIVLAPAYVLAFLIHGLLHPQTGATVRERLAAIVRGHRLFVALSVLILFAVLATGSLDRFLGGYAEPTRGSVFPPGTAPAARELMVYVVGAIGLVPLALTIAWVATTLGRRAGPAEHATASVTLSVVVVMTAIGAAFTVRYTTGINDRYLFYVIPLLLAGSAAFLTRPATTPRRVALAVAGAATAWLFATSAIVQQGPSLVSPSMSFHTVMWERAADLGTNAPDLLGWVALGATAVLVALLGRRLLAPVVLGVLLVYCAVETSYTFDKVAATQEGTDPAFVARRGWVDRALPQNAQAVTVLASLGPAPATTADWWDVSFWNGKVRAVYAYPGGSEYDQSFARELAIDERTGHVPTLDPFAYVVRFANDARFGLRGSRTVASDGGIVVLQADRPYRAEWRLKNADPNSSAIGPGERASVRVFAPEPREGEHLAEVTLAAPGAKEAVIAELRSGAQSTFVQVPAGGRATKALRVPYRDGHGDMTVSVPEPAEPLTLVGVRQA